LEYPALVVTQPGARPSPRSPEEMRCSLHLTAHGLARVTTMWANGGKAHFP